jgi:hypothetical protein
VQGRVKVEGFHQRVRRPELEGLRGTLDLMHGRDDHYGDPRIEDLHALEDLQPIHPWQAQIEQEQGEGFPLEARQPRLTGGGGGHLKLLFQQDDRGL